LPSSIVALMLPLNIVGQEALRGITMKETVAQESKDAARISEPEAVLAPQNTNTLNPYLMEFVRLLARRAAREWYQEIAEGSRAKRS
jgi:hypothetical protein